MIALAELVHKGGPVMFAILALSIVLYARCFRLILELTQARRRVAAGAVPHDTLELSLEREDVREMFRRERIVLGSLIAAAPLLGLLGTVSGMTKTFGSLTSRGSEQSMERLAQGISEVLVATESGLLVAIPALLIVYLAHHGVRLTVRDLNRLEERVRTRGAA